MGLEMLIPLLISVLSPIVTEGVKQLVGMAGMKLPSASVPAVSALVGTGAALLIPELGVDGVMGAAAGLGGTGLHQMKNAGKYTKK